MSHEYIIEPPNTCGYILDPVSNNFEFFDTAETVIACPDKFSEFYSFATKEECYSSILQIDPACPKNTVYGPLPVDFTTNPSSDNPYIAAPSGTAVTLSANLVSPEEPNATVSYSWQKNYNGQYVEFSTESSVDVTSVGSQERLQVVASISGASDWTNRTGQSFTLN